MTKKRLYERIVFMQGEDADETLAILDEHGTDAAITHLLQWDNGDGGDFHCDPVAGKQDTVVRRNPYILTYNMALNYIGLERRVKE